MPGLGREFCNFLKILISVMLKIKTGVCSCSSASGQVMIISTG
jgi:hypothetical protein